ncbi:hypothetical protein BH23PAT2_BH23PAT2_04310 [soil metagenome]
MAYELADRASRTVPFTSVEHNVASILDEEGSRICAVQLADWIVVGQGDDNRPVFGGIEY